MQKITSILSATCLVAVLGAVPAYAADLGGDCCADLEERIAELEATTVRKGNRKVSLKLSGHVNRAVMFWDNGYESNAYVIDNGNSSTRFRMTGGASINSDLKAGFRIELGVYSARSLAVTENNDDLAGGAVKTSGERVAVRKAFWYLDSKSLGRITVGTMDQASDDIAEIDLGGINAPGYHNGFLMGSNIGIYTTAGAPTGKTQGSVFFGEQTGDDGDIVRYDSPTIAGFKASASWGEDDMWDVALRYANQLGDLRVAAGVGYLVNTEQSKTPAVAETRSWGGSIAVMHTPTGLWADFSYSYREKDYVAPATKDENRDEWSVSAGITQKFVSLGKTTLYGQYSDHQGYENSAGLSDDGTMWGLGAIQHIDAAAMQLYVGYRHYTFDLDRTLGVAGTVDDHDVLVAGAKIVF